MWIWKHPSCAALARLRCGAQISPCQDLELELRGMTDRDEWGPFVVSWVVAVSVIGMGMYIYKGILEKRRKERGPTLYNAPHRTKKTVATPR